MFFWIKNPLFKIELLHFYMKSQVILAFLFVLSQYLLEDRRTIDVIITKFFPLCFEMAESFAGEFR